MLTHFQVFVEQGHAIAFKQVIVNLPPSRGHSVLGSVPGAPPPLPPVHHFPDGQNVHFQCAFPSVYCIIKINQNRKTGSYDIDILCGSYTLPIQDATP
ncbi:hypothetical protein TNIN_488541 [Trichonephila inaurata madagascariensis]|uniref:Uncharacterized protein n=1 Tax=Trichonephila inaurata madagascariensis TaxID=2747483 RepID=A0A8X6XCA8_9ARAC|nr:hypothetical protein TNIN_488541 [Trichonephila inaurata madagascariensis]